MYQTKYHKPASVDDAIAALNGAEDGKFLSGGQTLLATMKQRLAAPTDLVDLRGIPDMVGISVDGDTVTIGAATTHAEVAANPDLAAAIPALAGLAVLIGDPAVRHMGTIGGSLANNDPAADYPAAVMGLNGTIITNQRELPAEEYFQGLFTTALEEDEVDHRHPLSQAQTRQLSEIPQPGLAFRAGGGDGGRYGGRPARCGDGRRL